MIRFSCPACDKTLKAPEALAGMALLCRCGERAIVPGPVPRPPAGGPDEPPGFFSHMTVRTGLAAASALAAGTLGLFAAVVPPLAGGATWLTAWGLAVALVSALLLAAVLWGHGTGCPRCGAWWSRREVGSEVGHREEFQRGGVTFKRSTTRAHFRCEGCGHGWSVADSEEYPAGPAVEDGARGRKPEGMPHGKRGEAGRRPLSRGRLALGGEEREGPVVP